MSDQPAPAKTDTPIAAPTFPPASASDQVKAFIGDLARPFAIYVTSASAACAAVIIAVRVKVPDFSGGAIFIGAVFAGVASLYAAKAWELNTQAKEATKVEVTKATAAPQPTA